MPKTRSAATRSGQLDVGEELRPLPGCEDAYVQQNHSFAFRLSGLAGGPETEIRDFISKESFDGHQPFYAKGPGSNQFGTN